MMPKKRPTAEQHDGQYGHEQHPPVLANSLISAHLKPVTIRADRKVIRDFSFAVIATLHRRVLLLQMDG